LAERREASIDVANKIREVRGRYTVLRNVGCNDVTGQFKKIDVILVRWTLDFGQGVKLVSS
jgi:hypothetical protein